MLARARMHVLGAARLRAALWVIGGAAVGGGALLALNRFWIVALLTVLTGAVFLWLTGASVLRGGGDTYFMHLRRCLSDGFRGAEWSYDASAHDLRRLRAALDRLEPPATLEREHSRLVELLDESYLLANDTSIELKERARAAALAFQQARRQGRVLSEQQGDASPRGYVEAVANVTRRSQARIAQAHRRAERYTEAIVDRLRRIEPPADLASGHSALVEDARAYLHALRAYQAASQALELDATTTSIADLEGARARLERRIDALWAQATVRAKTVRQQKRESESSAR